MLIEPAGAGVRRRAGADDTACLGLNRWLRRNGRIILACTLGAAGLIVATDGWSG
jgi:hypothetical protein